MGYNDSLREVAVDTKVPDQGLRVLDKLAMIPGLILDFTGTIDGQVWDFNDDEVAQRAERLVKEKRALLVVTSPTCAAASIAKTATEAGCEGTEVLEHNQRHVDWCTKLCRLQHDNGMYFVQN